MSGYYYWKNTRIQKVEKVDELALAAFRSQVDSSFAARAYPPRQTYPGAYKNEKIIPLQSFNPNLDSEAALKMKGVPAYVAHSIAKYKNAGGGFKVKEDLAKMYTIDREMYARLLPYIDLPVTNSAIDEIKDDIKESKLEREVQSGLDINTLTTAELEALPGIGEFYAKQIVKYREKLGGFVRREQLLEVYKMRKESAEEIGEMFVFGQGIKKLNINNATFKELLQHPYLSYNQVKALVNYREQHGDYKSLDEIQNLHIFRGKDVRGLLPYLDPN